MWKNIFKKFFFTATTPTKMFSDAYFFSFSFFFVYWQDIFFLRKNILEENEMRQEKNWFLTISRKKIVASEIISMVATQT